MAYAGGSYAPSSETIKCFSAIIFQKLPSCIPIRKLWNMIFWCHDCNCNMHLYKFSAMDVDLQKKINENGHFRIFSHNLEYRQHRSPKKRSTLLFLHNLQYCIDCFPISKNKYLAPLFKEIFACAPVSI